MLFAEQGGRAQHGDLLAAGHRAESGAQRDFGLAEADVAADQAIHRLAGTHVVDDGGDGRRLIVGFLEAEAVGEGLVIAFLEGEGMALAGGAGSVEREQFGGGVARLFGRLALGLFPLAGTEGVQRRAFRVGAGVARNHVQLRHRHEQLGLVGVMQFEEFLLAEAEVHAHQPTIAPDAVAFMHHRVADLEFGEILQPVVESGFLLRLAPRAARRAGEQLGFGDEGQIVQRETGLQGADAERQLRVAGQKAGQIGAGGGLQVVFAEHRGQRFAAAGGFGNQQHAALEAGEMVLQRTQRIVAPAVDRHIGQFSGCVGIFGIQGQSTVTLRRREESFVGQEQFFRRQQRARLVALQQVVARAGVGPEGGNRRRRVAVRDEDGILRQVIENARRFVEEQRQVILDAGAGDAGRNVLVDPRFGRVALETLAEALAEMRAPLVVHRKLARRQQAHFRHRIDGALGIDVEGLDALDLVVEQVEPVGQLRTHRKEIDQAAANRVFAGRHHLRDVRVAGQRHLAAELLGVELLALPELESVGGHELRRRQPIDCGRRRNEQDFHLALQRGPQRGKALGNEILMRRKVVVRQRFPVRQQPHPEAGREPRDFIQQPLRIGGAGRDYRQQPPLALAGQFGKRQRIRRTGQQRQIDTGAGLGQGGEGKQGAGGGHDDAGTAGRGWIIAASGKAIGVGWVVSGQRRCIAE